MNSKIFVQAGGTCPPNRSKHRVRGDRTIGGAELLDPNIVRMIELSETLFQVPKGMHIYFYRDLARVQLGAFGWAHWKRDNNTGDIACWIQVSLIEDNPDYPVLLTIPHEFKHVEDYGKYGRSNESSARHGEWTAAANWWRSPLVPAHAKTAIKRIGGYDIGPDGVARANGCNPVDLKTWR